MVGAAQCGLSNVAFPFMNITDISVDASLCCSTILCFAFALFLIYAVCIYILCFREDRMVDLLCS